MKTCSLTIALKDFFGMKPGQTMTQFFAEVRALNDDDRSYFKKHLEATGNYKITNEAAQTAQAA